MNTIWDVIVVGAGPAGLSASYYLKQSGLNHIVLDRGQIGESWLSQRWDSFRMNTADKLNLLPGEEKPLNDPDNFSSATSFVDRMNEYVQKQLLPVIENAKVYSIDKLHNSNLFIVSVVAEGVSTDHHCKQVIIASGSQSEKVLSPLASGIAAEIKQLHSSEYRNPQQLPSGAVLIVGSGQSGCQISEDLISAGRKVYLSTSKVPRCPRQYRGKDIMDWLIEIGFFNTPAEEVAENDMPDIRTPLLKGTQGGRQSLSLQALAQNGVTLFGSLQKAEGWLVQFQNNLVENLEFADAFSARVKGIVDGYIEDNKLDAAAATIDPDDNPATLSDFLNADLSLRLNEQKISSIIWANGFRSGFDYIKLPVLDTAEKVEHQHGIAAIEGLYFLGLHWQRYRKSNILFGIKEDAKFIAEHIIGISKRKKIYTTGVNS